MKNANPFRFYAFALLALAAMLSPAAKAQTSSNSSPLRIGFYYPTNGQVFNGPTNVGLHAWVLDSNVVQTVSYFSGTALIGTVTNTNNVVLTNTTTANPFFFNWTNVGVGTYVLTSVGNDSAGNVATSAPVTITVQSPPPPPPPHPVAYIYSPTNNSVFLSPTNISIYARAVETSNVIQQVQFFAGPNSLGIVTNSLVYSNISIEPLYELTWTNPSPGNYPLTAVAMDAHGITATSQVVNISVVTNLPPPPPPNPVVYIYSPTNNSRFTVPANVGIYAHALETGGAIASVQFFAGTSNLGTVTNTGIYSNISSVPLYELTWSNAPLGNFPLTAVATDTNGLMATSQVVSISIVSNTPPPPVPFVVGWYYPTNGQTFTAPASVGLHASVTDSNVVRTMQYFANSALIATVTNTSNVLFTNISTGNPFFYGWSNVAAGPYVLTAVATDTAGATATSAPITITVGSPPPPKPVVYIYSPTNNSKFTAPANVSIFARAIENGGTIASVQFFAGTSNLGTVTNTGIYSNISSVPLYELTWSNAPLGNFPLTAVATDTNGLMATSQVVSISIVSNTPPPPVPFVVGWYYPTNGQTFTAPASVGLHASVTDSNVVRTMQYFANSALIATVTNTSNVLFTNISTGNPFFYGWSNVAAGPYVLTAVATDTAGATATSAPITITVGSPPPPKPVVYIYSPTNNSKFTAPANVSIFARAIENGGTIASVQFFAGTSSLGNVTNSGIYSNISSAPLYELTWSNAPLGNFPLTAVATDTNGLMATSQVVNISIVSNTPPPPVPFVVGWYYPTNGQTFTAPASVGLHASVTDSNVVRTMQYFANSTLIATVTNTGNIPFTNISTGNPFFYGWSNVTVGNYVLTAVATDVAGATATSAPITIYVIVPTNHPPIVRIVSPPNAASFRSPVNIPIYAYAYDPDGTVTGVEFFAGTNDLGPGNQVARGTNVPPTSYYSNYFFVVWSNAPVGPWTLTAQATDNSNAVTVSPPVNITVLPPVIPLANPIPIVLISAIDPVAIEGTNCWVWPGLSNAVPNWSNWVGGTVMPFTNCGPKNATFRVYHSGDTNNPLTVNYSIGGTASNGVDYVTLPGTVTIPAGQRTAMISIVPLDDGPPDTNSTVILRLTPSTTPPPTYKLGSQSAAEAVILDGPPTGSGPTAAAAVLPDQTFHLNASGPNGAWFHIEASTDMQTWTPICTNQVVNGSIDFADPGASNSASKFYRAIPETNPPQ